MVSARLTGNPGMPLGFSQTFESSRTWLGHYAGMGPVPVAIEISEQAPFRNEVIGIFGTWKRET
jgi:hypothetical protein